MKITRVVTRQGHPVPDRVIAPRGPFPPEILAEPVVIDDYEPQDDSGGAPIPSDGTAQNGFRAVRWFRCRDCSEVLRENELEEHDCPEDY